MFSEWLIRMAAFLAPADCRDEWRREWLGELHASGAAEQARLPSDRPAGHHGHSGQGVLVLLGRDAAEDVV